MTLIGELREEADRIVRELAGNGVTEIKLLQEHIHDGDRPGGLRGAPGAAR